MALNANASSTRKDSLAVDTAFASTHETFLSVCRSSRPPLRTQTSCGYEAKLCYRILWIRSSARIRVLWRIRPLGIEGQDDTLGLVLRVQ